MVKSMLRRRLSKEKNLHGIWTHFGFGSRNALESEDINLAPLPGIENWNRRAAPTTLGRYSFEMKYNARHNQWNERAFRNVPLIETSE